MDDGGRTIAGKRIALLVEHGFEDGELFGVLNALRAAGAEVVLVGSAADPYRGTDGGDAAATLAAGRARAADFDAVVIPGGWAPDRIRMRHAMVDLVRDATAAGKPVAAICRGAQVLISARAVQGRMVTCWPSIAVDVKNAGGLYVDKPVVRDGNLITARKIDDVAPFSAAIVHALAGAPAAAR